MGIKVTLHETEKQQNTEKQMEDTGLGINELLNNSGELLAITGLHRSDIQREDDYSDDSDDEIAEYLNDLETNDIEESDHESGPPSPVRKTSTSSFTFVWPWENS